MTKAKKYRVLRGSERGDVRYEAGEIVTAQQLKGWDIKALLAKHALEEVKDNGDGQD